MCVCVCVYAEEEGAAKKNSIFFLSWLLKSAKKNRRFFISALRLMGTRPSTLARNDSYEDNEDDDNPHSGVNKQPVLALASGDDEINYVTPIAPPSTKPAAAAAATAATTATTAVVANADKQYFDQVMHNACNYTLHALLIERNPDLVVDHLPKWSFEPLIRRGLFSVEEMRVAIGRYLRLGVVEGQWEQAWQQIKEDAAYEFTDARGDFALGKPAITKRLRGQLAFLPYASYVPIFVQVYENMAVFYVLNVLCAKNSKRQYVIANFSMVWASHIDKRTNMIMFNVLRDMYDKTLFITTILAYLEEDLAAGGDATTKFLAAAGHQTLGIVEEHMPHWMHGVLQNMPHDV